MSLEDSINTLALAIEQLADAITRDKREPAKITIVKGGGSEPAAVLPVIANERLKEEVFAMLMDDAGVPSKFKSRCGICGELGRNARTCKPTAINGSYHWIEVER
jgi:hypothetical protein